MKWLTIIDNRFHEMTCLGYVMCLCNDMISINIPKMMHKNIMMDFCLMPWYAWMASDILCHDGWCFLWFLVWNKSYNFEKIGFEQTIIWTSFIIFFTAFLNPYSDKCSRYWPPAFFFLFRKPFCLTSVWISFSRLSHGLKFHGI